MKKLLFTFCLIIITNFALADNLSPIPAVPLSNADPSPSVAPSVPPSVPPPPPNTMAPNTQILPPPSDWTTFNTTKSTSPNQSITDNLNVIEPPFNKDTIIYSKKSLKPIDSNTFASSSPPKPVNLTDNIKDANSNPDAKLSTIIGSDLNLKSTPIVDTANFRTRQVYDYRKKAPSKFFQKKFSVTSNAQLPNVFYQSDYTKLLFSAVNAGNIGAISTLLDKGADINGALNPSNNTPLISSIIRGLGNITQYLILRGANVNKANREGQTPLHIATLNRDYPIIKFLTDNGASIDATDHVSKKAYDYLPDDHKAVLTLKQLKTQSEFNNALLEFSKEGIYSGVQQSLNKGADANTQDPNGSTPLILATIANKDLRIIQLLLQNGANPLITDKTGAIAFDYAMKNGDLALKHLVDTYTIKYELDHDLSRPGNYALHEPNQSLAPADYHNYQHLGESISNNLTDDYEALTQDLKKPNMQTDAQHTDSHELLPESKSWMFWDYFKTSDVNHDIVPEESTLINESSLPNLRADDVTASSSKFDEAPIDIIPKALKD